MAPRSSTCTAAAQAPPGAAAAAATQPAAQPDHQRNDSSLSKVSSSPLLLAMIFERLPPVESALTVGRLSRTWRSWAAPRAAALRTARRRFSAWRAYAEPPAPDWLVREAWSTLTEAQRDMVVARAAFHGSISTLEFAWADPAMCIRMSRPAGPGPSVCLIAADGGAVDSLRWARAAAIGCPWDLRAGRAAAAAGRLRALQWLWANGAPRDPRVAADAAAGGHLPVLRWLRDAGGCNGGCRGAASTSGGASGSGTTSGSQARSCAGSCCWDAAVPRAAAAAGNVEVLRWLRLYAPRCPWGPDACAAAAGNGHLPALAFLCANGCPWDADTCAAAAACGNLELLQWVRARGCPWDYETAAAAAAGGHLAVLQWAVGEAGAPLDVARAVEDAIGAGQQAVLAMLAAEGWWKEEEETQGGGVSLAGGRSS